MGRKAIFLQTLYVIWIIPNEKEHVPDHDFTALVELDLVLVLLRFLQLQVQLTRDLERRAWASRGQGFDDFVVRLVPSCFIIEREVQRGAALLVFCMRRSPCGVVCQKFQCLYQCGVSQRVGSSEHAPFFVRKYTPLALPTRDA